MHGVLSWIESDSILGKFLILWDTDEYRINFIYLVEKSVGTFHCKLALFIVAFLLEDAAKLIWIQFLDII